MQIRQRRGFTLIELMVVMSIISMLSSVILASVQSARDKGRIAAGLRFERHTIDAFGDSILAEYNFDDACSGNLNPIATSWGSNQLNLTAVAPRSCSSGLSSDTPNGKGTSFNLGAATGNYHNIDVTTQQFTPFSIGFWFKSASANGDYLSIEANNGDLAVELRFDPSVINFYIEEGLIEGTDKFIAPAQVAYDDKWHYVFLSMKGDKLTVFWDGKKMAVHTFESSVELKKNKVSLTLMGRGTPLKIDHLVFLGDATQ